MKLEIWVENKMQITVESKELSLSRFIERTKKKYWYLAGGKDYKMLLVRKSRMK